MSVLLCLVDGDDGGFPKAHFARVVCAHARVLPHCLISVLCYVALYMWICLQTARMGRVRRFCCCIVFSVLVRASILNS